MSLFVSFFEFPLLCLAHDVAVATGHVIHVTQLICPEFSCKTERMPVQDISNVSPWSQITAQFNLFNSGSDSTPSAPTAGRHLLQTNSSFADFAPQDTAMSDLTKEGMACHQSTATYKKASVFPTGLQIVLCSVQYSAYET